MQRHVAIDLMRRAITVAENQWPEMADAHMEVPLEYFVNEEFAARERTLFETSPLALVAANEIANPMNHPTGVFRFSTIELILSVTEANVSPGAITGAVASPTNPPIK